MSNGKWIFFFFLMKGTVPFHQSRLKLQQEIQYASVGAVLRTATHEGRATVGSRNLAAATGHRRLISRFDRRPLPFRRSFDPVPLARQRAMKMACDYRGGRHSR